MDIQQHQPSATDSARTWLRSGNRLFANAITQIQQQVWCKKLHWLHWKLIHHSS